MPSPDFRSPLSSYPKMSNPALTQMNESNGIAGWLDSIKAIWRYGYKSPIKVKKL